MILLTIGSAWGLKTLEIKWCIHPCVCKMYNQSCSAPISLIWYVEAVPLCLRMRRCLQWPISMMGSTGILWIPTTLWMLHSSTLQLTQPLKTSFFLWSSFIAMLQCCPAHPMDVLVSPLLRIGPWWRGFDMTVSNQFLEQRLFQQQKMSYKPWYVVHTDLSLYSRCFNCHLGILFLWKWSPNCDWCLWEGCRISNLVLDPREWSEKVRGIGVLSNGKKTVGISGQTCAIRITYRLPHSDLCVPNRKYFLWLPFSYAAWQSAWPWHNGIGTDGPWLGPNLVWLQRTEDSLLPPRPVKLQQWDWE